MNNLKDLKKYLEKSYGDNINGKVEKYQKKYGFKIGQGEHATWNNEADAFKHTFMQADLTLKFNSGISKLIGDNHESKPNNDPGEKNMDLWNNQRGREIGEKIRKKYMLIPKKYFILLAASGFFDNEIAKEVISQMKKGYLITNPNDRRNFSKDYTSEEEMLNSKDKFGFNKEQQDLIKYYSRLFNNPSSVLSAQAYENEKLFNDVVNRYYPNLKYSTGLENGHWVTINGNHVFIKDKK